MTDYSSRVRQWRQRYMSVPVERVVSTKGHGVAARQQMSQATFHHPASVKVVHVQEGGQNDSENVRAGELLGQRFDEEAIQRGKPIPLALFPDPKSWVGRSGRPTAIGAAAASACLF